MTQTYQARRRAQQAPAEQKLQTGVPGPSLSELAAGAMPSAQQMGHRVDLPDAIREKMEASFGADFSGVKLYESQTVADAGAQAMTMGSNVAFAPGQLDLASTSGQALLGHELSHVVSQARGESAGQGFLADAGLEAQADRQGALAAQGESVYSGPVAPLSASAVPASAGPLQAAGKSLDEDDLDELARNDAAENKEGLVTTANLPSRFHFIKRRRALDQLRQQRAARLAAMRPSFPEPEVLPVLPPRVTFPEGHAPEPAPTAPAQEEDPFGAVGSQGPVLHTEEEKAEFQENKAAAEDKAAEALEELQNQGFDPTTTPVGGGGGSLQQQLAARDPYSAVNDEGVVLRTQEQQQELQENKAAAEDKAVENLEKLQEQGFDPTTTPVGGGGGSLEQQLAAQQPYGASNAGGAVLENETKKKKRRKRKKSAEGKAVKTLKKLEDQGFDPATTPVGGGGGSLEQQLAAQDPYSAVNDEGVVLRTQEQQQEIQENRGAAEDKAAKSLKNLQDLGFDASSTPVGGGNGLLPGQFVQYGAGSENIPLSDGTPVSLEQQQRVAHRERQKQEALDDLKIFADEKALRGIKPEESYSGVAEYDDYLAAAMPFHNEEERKELMDAFRKGRQDPKTVGLLIRNDMKRVSETIRKKNRKDLLSKDKDKALDAHAALRRNQILAESIDRVLQKAKFWSSARDRGGEDPSGGLADYLKPEGKFAKTFKKRKRNFDKEMSTADLRRFRP